jgi:hypothetical protein
MRVARATQVIEGVAPDAIPFAALIDAQRPAILKGVAREWPLVQAGLDSAETAMAYLARFDAGRPVVGFTGAPAIGGRFAYNDDVSGFNFEGARRPLAEMLAEIAAHLNDPAPPSLYVGSTDLDTHLPGLGAENALALDHPVFAAHPPIVSIWIGNRTVAAAHYDQSNNLACCVAGRRRFTLFPPEQVANLYPGPLEPTPGGQVISMVDFAAPDLDRYPRFAEAVAAGEVAELEPGDVLFYPALWWHHVEALTPFNILINYWWNDAPGFLDTPQTTLLHAMLSLRDRPANEKAGWKALFDYYIFGDAALPAAHLPDHAQGNLAPMDDARARRLRAALLTRLNR